MTSEHVCDGECGGSFLCPGSETQVGYCQGCGDALGELCDDCACAVVKARELHGNPDEWSWWKHPGAS